VGRDVGVARNQVQSPGPGSGRFKSQNPIRPQKLGCERVVGNSYLIGIMVSIPHAHAHRVTRPLHTIGQKDLTAVVV